jgi:hypothetical protein
MVLIFPWPFVLSLLNPLHPSPNDHGLYTLTLIKCNTIWPKTYVIRVGVIDPMSLRCHMSLITIP